MTSPVRLDDAKLERLLRNNAEPSRQSQEGGCRRETEHWGYLSLQSACLSAFDICLTPQEERTKEMVESSVMRRFTNRHYRYHSAEHFLQERYRIITHLQRFLVERPCPGILMARFETFSVYVEKLDLELSQHFHMIYTAEGGSGEYVVQKLVEDDNENALALYRHMTTVFGAYAFGRVPARIEALLPLSGRVLAWEPNDASLSEALDYMALVKSMLQGAGEAISLNLEN